MMKRCPVILILVLTVFLDSICLGLVTPINPLLLLDTGARAFISDPMSPSLRGTLLGILGLSFMFGQFFAAPVLGDLSATKGIKKTLVPALFVIALSNLIGAASILQQSIWFLILSQLLRGAATANRTILQLYAVEVSDHKSKIKNLGWIGAGGGFGLIIGPYLGGKLIAHATRPIDYAWPLWIAAMIALFNGCVTYALLNCLRNKRPSQVWSLSKGLQHLKKAIGIRSLKPLFFVILCYFVGWEMFYSFGPIFLLQRLHFQAEQVGMFYALIGLWSILGNSLLVRITSRFPSSTVLKWALPIWGLSLLSVALVKENWALWSLLPLMPSIGGVIQSTGAALFTDLVDTHLQGEVLGIFQSLQSVAAGVTFMVIGPLATQHPLCPVVSGALFLFIATIIWLFKARFVMGQQNARG